MTDLTDHQAAILKYAQGHPIIERRSEFTEAGLAPDVIKAELETLVNAGLLAIGGDKYTDLAHTTYLAGDGNISEVLSGVKGMKKTRPQMLDMVSKLRADFPSVDLLEEVKNWAMYKLDHPVTAKSNVALQLRTWMKKSLEYGGKANEQGRATTTGRQPTSDDARERSTRQPLS